MRWRQTLLLLLTIPVIVNVFLYSLRASPNFWKLAVQHNQTGMQEPRNNKALLIPRLRAGPQLWKTPPPPKNDQFRGQKHLEHASNFFSQLPNIYKIYILQKKWSKSTNPVLTSDPNNLLPLIGGCHHQLDDQYKEPMVNTKIIELGN